MLYKKLIETVMPVSIINKETEKEKASRSNPLSNIHIWWTRRSMAVTRSTLFASLIDDPSSHPELFPTVEAQNLERERLLQLTASLAVVENISNVSLLEEAKEEIRRYSNKPIPPVFDPFVGGGGTPVEAHRLGLTTVSSDLNAVAAMITMVVSDIPARFVNTEPVHPQEGMILGSILPGTQGFAEDVLYYGEWMQKEAEKRIGHLYPKIKNPENGKELTVSAWIWARTVQCPNPSCKCNIPLSSSYDLAKKKGAETWVEPLVEGTNVKFQIHHEPHKEIKKKSKVGQTAVFTCPACGEITPDSYVKDCGKRQQIDSQMIAVVANDNRKRLYIEPTAEQETAAKVAVPKRIPHGMLPNFPKRFSPPQFGLSDYADLYSNRQFIFLTTMLELTKEAEALAKKAAIDKNYANDGITFSEGGSGADAYGQAIRLSLVLVISKLLDLCSSICSWDSGTGGSLRTVFSRAAMPMIWDYAEANPFATAGGSFHSALVRTCKAIAALPAGVKGSTIVADCTVPNKFRDMIVSTDLPYYDRCSYSDLSDYFYVWLKYGLEDMYPEYFKEELSSKKEELTAFSYRWNGDKKQANAFYVEGLNLAFKNIAGSMTEEYPSTVSYIYKRDTINKEGTMTEWEAFITAIYNAKLSITAAWPLGKKSEENIALSEARGVPVTVVVRKKPDDAPIVTRRAFVTNVKQEVPLIVEELQETCAIEEIRVSVIGKALNIYMRNKQVLDATGEEMEPYMAVRIIEDEIDMVLHPIYEAVNKDNAIKEETTND